MHFIRKKHDALDNIVLKYVFPNSKIFCYNGNAFLTLLFVTNLSFSKTNKKKVYVECVLRLVVLRVLCCSKCLFLFRLFCHVFLMWSACIVCNRFSLNISSIYIKKYTTMVFNTTNVITKCKNIFYI